jgi:protein BCP1
MDIVNVDFELFNYDPQIDFHGVKTLLRQLFDVDSKLIDLSAIADLIVEQNTIGSTCKVDDKSNDAYAFLTVLNLNEHCPKKPAVAKLAEYLAERAQADESLTAAGVPELLSASKAGEKKPVVGLVLAERLINMPAEVIPPMWNCLIDEIEAALEDGEPYEFTHYLVVSRAYYARKRRHARRPSCSTSTRRTRRCVGTRPRPGRTPSRARMRWLRIVAGHSRKWVSSRVG